MMKINFDMDGTIANLYGVDGWLDDIINEDARPYRIAEPLVNLSVLARYLNRLQKIGYEINIISWLARDSRKEYDVKVIEAKMTWLKIHLKSVKFDNIHIVPYGTPKESIEDGILFDDEQRNRENWKGVAYDVNNILEVLKGYLA